jgi:hypothetical protein
LALRRKPQQKQILPNPPFPKEGATAATRHWWPALTALLLWPGVGSAQVAATGDYLARMDRDVDGRVSLIEYQDWMGYAFERMDIDRDGILGTGELPGGRGRPVSLADHRESLAAAFRRQDRDHDGFLSAVELAAPPQ